MPDPVVVTETEMSLIKYLGGLAVTALGTLLALVYSKHEKDFDKLEAKVEKKADKDDTEKRLDKGSEKFDEVLNLLRDVKDGQTAMNGHLMNELAQRPTRQEVVQMLTQQGRG